MCTGPGTKPAVILYMGNGLLIYKARSHLCWFLMFYLFIVSHIRVTGISPSSGIRKTLHLLQLLLIPGPNAGDIFPPCHSSVTCSYETGY